MLYIGDKSFVISKKYKDEVLKNFLFLDDARNIRSEK
ncbi:MAG: hypothetical protein BACD_03856 [Bacteroides rodentium]